MTTGRSRRASRATSPLVGPTLAAVLAVVVMFAAPAPAGATPYAVATERLVWQLNSASGGRAASLLQGLPGAVPRMLPGGRWTTDLPDLEAADVGAALAGSAGVNYVSPVEAVHASGLVPDNPCYAGILRPHAPGHGREPLGRAGPEDGPPERPVRPVGGQRRSGLGHHAR